MLRLFILVLALVTVTGPAVAGPVAGVFAAINAAIQASAFLSAVTQLAIGMVLTAVARKLGPKPKGYEREKDVSLDVSYGDDLPLSIIVGKYATAGKRKYIGSWGRNTRFISDVIEVSAMPQRGIVSVWINDELATIDFNTVGVVDGNKNEVENVTHRPVSGSGGKVLGFPVSIGSIPDKTLLWIKWVDGTQTTVDPFLEWAFTFGTEYIWSGIGAGKSYAIITALYDEDLLNSLPTCVIEPTPLAMYDVRKDSSVGGSGSHRWGDFSTYEPTQNAAIIAYNIFRGIYWGNEWVFGGKNLPAWMLPRAEWVAAINACERSIETTRGAEPAYRCGFEISVDDAAVDVVNDIGRVANMRFSEVGGQIKPSVDLPTAAVFSLVDEDILITEGQNFAPFFPIVQTFNAMSATYPEPDARWATRDAPERVDMDARSDDKGNYLPTSVSYPACPFINQVMRIMRSQLLDYRRMRQHTFTLGPEAMVLEPLDMLSWTSVRNGYVNKKFIVEEITKLPNFCCVLSLREVDPADYDWNPSFELPYVIPTPVNVVPLPQGIFGWSAIALYLADNGGRNRKPAIQVACGANEVGIDSIRIQIERSGMLQFDFLRPYSAPHQWTFTDVAPETTYRVRGALISNLTGRYEWSEWITVTTFAEPIWVDQLSDEIWTAFEELAAQGGIKVVDTLPLTGDFADQVVMLRSNKQFYRWDVPTNQWSTDVYAGVADSSISSAKIISDNILSRHIASSNILTTHIGAGQVTADKIDVTELSAITANVGLLRTATSGGRIEIHNDMFLVYDTGNNLRVRLGRLW